ncbi:amidohydrolase [Neobacillus drentensis]|uniref:M20 metallopeptidase family protein n=1 Tax=Neobacillus drentensis TaxID=220684 RepID=UPI001F3C4BE0|nr:amidohydrolase [Neobacillus drentensis]ULT57042.1 amidohydrolase [Neobacillus drentensis]
MEQKNYELAVNLRHELHEHPELSNEEVWTKQHLMEFVKNNTKNLEIVDKGNWFYAIYRVGEDKPNIAFRADFDALPMDEYIDIPWGSKFPGKAHKCGHDGHASTLAGFALEVDQKGADKNIFFLFQPAEEVGNGAVQCVPMLKVEKIDEIYGYHNMAGMPFQSVNVLNGNVQCASTGMSIKMEGAPAHASQPETGKNPSFAIAKIVDAIPSLTENSKGLLLCTIVQINVGGRNFGMSAYNGELLLTIRALYEDELDQLRDNLIKIANEEAEKYGLKVSFEYSDSFPETKSSKECVDKVRAVAKEKGFELVEMEEPLRPSEDFGHYTKVIPAAYFYVGNGENYPHVHTSEYDFRDENIEIACEVFKGLAGTN